MEWVQIGAVTITGLLMVTVALGAMVLIVQALPKILHPIENMMKPERD